VLIWAACSTRSAGLAIVGALLLRTVLRRFARWQLAAVTVAVAGAATWMTGRLVSACSSTISDYVAELSQYDWRTPLTNAREYAGDLAMDVLFPIDGVAWVGKAVFAIFIVLVAAGLWRTLRERGGPTIWECFAVVYTGLLLVWPAVQGSRFLIPLLPWGTGHRGIAAQDLSRFLTNRKASAALPVAVALTVFTFYPPGRSAEG